VKYYVGVRYAPKIDDRRVKYKTIIATGFTGKDRKKAIEYARELKKKYPNCVVKKSGFCNMKEVDI
jgi:hypothetical protein